MGQAGKQLRTNFKTYFGTNVKRNVWTYIRKKIGPIMEQIYFGINLRLNFGTDLGKSSGTSFWSLLDQFWDQF